ncbi:hypothetical protein [Methanosarcina barkeri]|uniref:hypothetical protein n=1 Tax=Methanosarcina barkeri TaxID=2208 RepID=UPI001FB1EB81|nr:hypothetical protein [Methanosarcina barkeri]
MFFYMLIGIMPAAANEDEWSSLTVTLGTENSIVSIVSVDEYTIEALKFDGYGMVWLRVSKNGLTLGDTSWKITVQAGVIWTITTYGLRLATSPIWKTFLCFLIFVHLKQK